MFYVCVTLCIVQYSKLFGFFFPNSLGPRVPSRIPKCELCTGFTVKEYQTSNAGLLPICTPAQQSFHTKLQRPQAA